MTSYAPKTGDIDPAYSLTARVLHWITAALVLTMIPLGIIGANNWGGSWQDQIYDLHRSIGTLLIVIIIARLGYRLTHKPLPLPPDVPAAQRHAAHAVHWALYGLLLAQPFIGWAATSAYRAPIIVFGLFQLPPIIGENRAVSERLFTVHAVMGIAITALVAVHIGAALFHHYVRRDGVLLRMVEG